MPAEAAVAQELRIERIAAPLRQSVTESIRFAIAIGRFKAGERLPERKLCEMTGVSRTLVREALRQLESERLIEVVPHRGPVVARLTIEQAEGIYQVRKELEGLAFQLFAERATPDQLQDLMGAFKKLKKAFKFTDPMARLLAKNEFYDCLWRGTGNEALGDSLRMLNARVMLLRVTSMRLPRRVAGSLLELAELMNVLGTQDGNAARALAERHVENAARSALELLSSQQLLASLSDS
ncbi:MAG: GntR family transcriptional regulator [Hyphomicrobiaceae bacterium]